MSVRADRPRLTVLRPPARAPRPEWWAWPMIALLRSFALVVEGPRWYLWPLMRPLLAFGALFLVVLVVLAVVTPRWMAWGGLVFAAYEFAALPLSWKLYRDWSWFLEPGGQALWAIVLGPAAPYVYGFRLLREVWRCWRMRG